MKIFKNRNKLQKEISDINNISFVPTMGGLHKGHISLIKKSKKYSKKNLVSIFVNPKQFNDKKDFLRYPRNLKKDLMILKRLKVNYVYLPSYKDIFSLKTSNKIYLDKFSKKLCGKFRKGHFEGVINVVNRFLEIIKPKYLLLGEKDFQQLVLISKHIDKNKISSKIINCKTIREHNGIPCSTRNRMLTQSQLRIASNVHKIIKRYKSLAIRNIKLLRKKCLNSGINKIDYIEAYNTKTLIKPKGGNKYKIFIAFYLGKTRLIDNI
tara:strand:+ start:322 stop:1119 length:798 start_codon:yes stop_codon:yes gene_type:complete